MALLATLTDKRDWGFEVSAVVICDECGRVVKRLDALHCAKANTHANGLVYGADICKDCRSLFVTKFGPDGFRLAYKEKGDVK